MDPATSQPALPPARWLMLTLMLAACNGSTCPQGEIHLDGRCLIADTDADAATVRQDGGPDADAQATNGGDADAHTPDAQGAIEAGSDARGDAGPCPDGCAEDAPYCDELGDQCVACLADEHCTEPGAPRCDAETFTCAPCTDDAHCTGILAGDVALGVCHQEQCVQCNADNTDACGQDNAGRPYVCNALENRCSQYTQRSRSVCQPCDADDACQLGQRCAQQSFEGVLIGHFCFWEFGAQGAPSDCAEARPYVQSSPNTLSVDGARANLCTLRKSTCPAMTGFSSPSEDRSCNGADQNDQACGYQGVDDAMCKRFTSSAHLCTVPCTSSFDCEPGFACNGEKHCDLQTGTCYVPSDCPSGQTCVAKRCQQSDAAP